MTQTKNKTRYADIFFQLTKRHLLVFFKDKIRVLYTLLVPVIIFVVYIFFLRELELLMVKNTLLELDIVADDTMNRYIGALIDSWMLSGITALSTITVGLQTNTVFVEDKQNGVNRDFVSSPIHRNIVIGSYFLFNFIVTALICLVFLLVCFIYLACMNEFLIPFAGVLTIITCLVYTTVSATLMTIFICSFVKTQGTMASIVALFSTAIGFLIGAYMPLGMLPHAVKNLCGFIPGTYSCALMRYSFMAEPLEQLSLYVADKIPNGAELVSEVTATFGFDLQFFGIDVSPQWQCFAIAVFIVVFLALNVGFGKKRATVLGVTKKKKKKKN